MGGALDWFPEARDIVFVLSRLGECIMHVSMIYTFLVRLTTSLGEIMVRIGRLAASRFDLGCWLERLSTRTMQYSLISVGMHLILTAIYYEEWYVQMSVFCIVQWSYCLNNQHAMGIQ